jgi:hypothetical protein
MKSKSKCIPPGATVVLSGLERHPTLNHTRGETIGSFDGGRYSVKLSDGSIVRVTPDKLAPTCPVGFVDYVQRLTDELCVFAHHHVDQPSSLFPMEATSLGGKCNALSQKTSRIALSSTKLLCLYEGASNSPYMQLKPLQTVPVGNTARVAVMLYDSPTVVSAAIDCDARYIMLSCRGSTLFFENQMPIFHMSMSHMLSYMTERMTACLVDNYFEVVRYMRCANDVEDTTYDPKSRTLLFKLKTSDARGKIVCPAWNCDVFAVARHGHMTEYRISFLSKASSSERPSHAIYMFPIGSIVNNKNKKLTVGEDGFEDTRNFMPSADTFLQSQLVLAAHFVKYGLVSGQSISQHIRRHMDGIIALICDMVCQNSQKKIAQVAQKIMTLNVSDGTHFLLCPDFMDSVYKDEDRLVAWVANLESLLNAFTITLDCSNAVMSLDDGLLKVSSEASIELFLASFANDPIENQAWIFQRELSSISEATQTASLQQTIQRLASASSDMACNVESAISQVMTRLMGGDARCAEADSPLSSLSDKPTLGKKRAPKPEKVDAVHDDAKFQECLQRQQALIDEEEANRCKATTVVADKKKKKKKKKTKTNTVTLDDDDSSRVVEKPSSLLIEREEEEGEAAANPSTPSALSDASPSVDKVDTLTEFRWIDPSPNVCHADKEGDVTQSPASTSSSGSAEALSDAITEVDVSTGEPFQVMSTRANMRVDKMKKTLATAHVRIQELERKGGALRLELDKHRDKRQFDAQQIDSLRRDLSRSTNRMEMHKQMATRLATCNDRLNDMTTSHESVTLKCNSLALNVDNHSRMLLLKLAGQIRHYLKGHYMKLDQDTLSIPAVLRDGYAAIMLIDLYSNLMGENHVSSPEQVVHLAISTTLDMKATDSAGITWVSP